MTRLLLAGLALLGACAHGPPLPRHDARQDAPIDSLYQKALAHLIPANKHGSLDSAVKYLELYLVSAKAQAHRAEGEAMRKLAQDAQQLAKLEGALQQGRASTENKPREIREHDAKRDEEAVKEIQRLKEELAKANEELERIRKRLAAPKPER